jgi:hypothetical protein
MGIIPEKGISIIVYLIPFKIGQYIIFKEILYIRMTKTSVWLAFMDTILLCIWPP